MAKINFKFFLLLAVGILATSCTNENEMAVENTSADLLKSINLKRTANGSYYLDLNVNTDTKVDKVFDETTGVNKFYLYASPTQTSRNMTESLNFSNSQIKVGFVDANSNKKSPTIIIEDDEMKLAKKASEKLTSFGVKTNDDGSFDLDFTVADGVSVSFKYNDSLGVYEIHLETGKSSTISYSQTYNRVEGKPLIIDFVNHFDNVSAKSEVVEEAPRKPRIIIDSGGL